MRQTIDIGIDLGTTNSLIAMFRDDGVMVFKDGPSETIPSVVRVDRRGNVYVGATAYDKLHVDPQNTHSEFKRLMGTDKKLTFVDADRAMLPEELSAEVLKTLRALPSERGETVDAAVITVPAMFELPASAATMKAGELAGLDFVTLLQEPIAAAYAYGLREDVGGYLFVYDLGGGTFDASILRADGRLAVVDHAGNNHLGGKNFDWLIVDGFFLPALAEKYELPDLNRKDPRYRTLIAKLKAIAERCKIDLSRMEKVLVYEEGLGTDAGGKSIDLDVEVTRPQYEQLVHEPLEDTIAICLKLLKDNNLQPSDIKQLLLVGGPTRTPLLRRLIDALKIPVDLDIDPMTVVARGAAIHARSQRRPRGPVDGDREEGKFYATLEYAPMSETEETLLGGRIEVDGGAELPAGCTIEVTHTDGHWQSGRIPLGATNTFICTVHLNRRESNEFQLRLRDGKDQVLELEPGSVTITHGIRTEEPPMRSTVRIGLADGTTKVVIAKGTQLPVTSPEIALRTVRLLQPGTGDHIVIPILEGEEERADRNRGGGRLLLRADKLRRDLPPGSRLDFTMKIDSSGVPERVTVYSPYLDEWFVDFERATTEFASQEELEHQLDYEKKRLEQLQQQAREAGERGVEDRARAVARGRIIRDIEKQIEAVEGGDVDAAGVARNALIDVGKEIDGIEAEVEWPRTLSAYEAERSDCRRVVHQYGKRIHEEQLAAIENEAEACIREQDKTGLEQRTQAMIILEVTLLREQPGFWPARFQWLSQQEGRFTDPARARALLIEGKQALDRQDIYSLQTVCDNLASLLPPNVLSQAPGGAIRSDVEL